MKGYDINFLRSSEFGSERRSPASLLPVLVAVGILLAGAEGVLRREAAARRADVERRLVERREEARTRASFQEGTGLREAVRARADRVLWRVVLLAVAEALPPGHRLEKVAFDESAGVLRFEVRGDGRASPGAIRQRLRDSPRFGEFFSEVREYPGEGGAYSIVCDRRSVR
jgi:hypothetical protein